MQRFWRRLVLMGTLFSAACGTVLSQTTPSTGAAAQSAARDAASVDQQRAALDKLKEMVGNWTGSGWIATGPGKRAEFTQSETVQSKLDGTLFTIDGEGRDKNQPGKIVHSAFAVLTYDAGRRQYRYLAFSGGRFLDLVPEVSDHGWRWGFDTPYGKIRYTLDFTAGTWKELGEISRDNGQTWSKNFEMTLTRKQ